MKRILVLATVFLISTSAFALPPSLKLLDQKESQPSETKNCPNFTGFWETKGTHDNGGSYEMSLFVSQNRCDSFTIGWIEAFVGGIYTSTYTLPKEGKTVSASSVSTAEWKNENKVLHVKVSGSQLTESPNHFKLDLVFNSENNEMTYSFSNNDQENKEYTFTKQW